MKMNKKVMVDSGLSVLQADLYFMTHLACDITWDIFKESILLSWNIWKVTAYENIQGNAA